MAGQRLKGVRDPALLLLLLDTDVTGAAPTAINHIEFKMIRKNNTSERRELLPTRKWFMAAPVKRERDGSGGSSCQAGHSPALTIEKARRFRIRLNTSTAKDNQSIVGDCDTIFRRRIGRLFLPFHSGSNFTFPQFRHSPVFLL
jgi:hypothetical protein